MKNILLLFTLLFLSCSDNITPDPEPTGPMLPAITAEGLNTFGCLKDGEVWLPSGLHDLFNANPDASYDEANNFLSVVSTQNEEFNILELMRFSGSLNAIGLYEILPNSNNSIVIYNDFRTNSGNSSEYFLDTLYHNYYEIFRLDTMLDIVSGTFEFQVINPELQDTILFTEGRFDLEYTY